MVGLMERLIIRGAGEQKAAAPLLWMVVVGLATVVEEQQAAARRRKGVLLLLRSRALALGIFALLIEWRRGLQEYGLLVYLSCAMCVRMCMGERGAAGVNVRGKKEGSIGKSGQYQDL